MSLKCGVSEVERAMVDAVYDEANFFFGGRFLYFFFYTKWAAPRLNF